MSVNNLEDKLVISRAFDTLELASKRNCPAYFGFLNEHEVALIKNNVKFDIDYIFFGGFDNAQRVVLACNTDNTALIPISALKFTYKEEYDITNKDFLGALMSLGIDRSTVGDILVFSGYSIVFVKDDVCEYILSQITKIGRVGVNVEEIDASSIEYQPEYETLSFTLSSLRLDVFVASLCKVSRDSAQQLIKSDKVLLNHVVVNSVSKSVNISDVLTIRKHGKYIYSEFDGFSKKNKLRVTVKKFK